MTNDMKLFTPLFRFELTPLCDDCSRQLESIDAICIHCLKNDLKVLLGQSVYPRFEYNQLKDDTMKRMLTSFTVHINA